MSEPFQPLIQVPLIEAVFEIFVPPEPDMEQQQQQRALLERFKQELGTVSQNRNQRVNTLRYRLMNAR